MEQVERAQGGIESGLLDALPDFVVAVDAERCIVYANAAARTLTELDPVGRPLREAYPQYALGDELPGELAREVEVIPFRSGLILRWQAVPSTSVPDELATSVLQTVLDHIPDGVTLVGGPPDYRIEYVSPQASVITGRPEERLVGHRVGEHMEAWGIRLRGGLPLTSGHQSILYRAVYGGEEIVNAEMAIERPDGEVVPVLCDAAPVRDSRGEIVGAIMALRDISVRVEEEREIRQARSDAERNLAYWDAVVDSMADGLVVAEMSGDIVYWNPAALRIHGFATLDECRDHLSRMPDLFSLQTASGEEAPLEDWPLAKALAGETVTDQEWRVLRKDTGEEWTQRYSGTPIRSRDGQMLGALVTLQDVTERHATDAALRETVERLALALQASNMGDWTWDSNTDSVDFSERAAEIFGIPPGPFLSWTEMRSILHPEDREPVARAVTRALETGGNYDVEYRIDRHGEQRWVAVRGRGEYDAAGRPLGMLGVVVDVTDRREAEEALRESERQLRRINETLEEMVRERTAELEAANAELEGFTYSVSHDLRAPLRAIVATSRMILDDQGDVSEETRELLQRQISAGNLMAELIDDLLHLARVSRAEIEPKRFDLSMLAEEVVQEVRARNPDVDAEYVVEPGLTAVGDPRFVKLLVQNLIENATKFRVPGRRPLIRVGREGNEFFVKDNGVGFDMAYAERLFRPFERLHRKDEYPGTGIGLANVKRVAERHGGSVRAEGHAGEGATFYFTLGPGV